MEQRREQDFDKENMGCNEYISDLGVKEVRNRKVGSVSEITYAKQECMLIILSVRM